MTGPLVGLWDLISESAREEGTMRDSAIGPRARRGRMWAVLLLVGAAIGATVAATTASRPACRGHRDACRRGPEVRSGRLVHHQIKDPDGVFKKLPASIKARYGP